MRQEYTYKFKTYDSGVHKVSEIDLKVVKLNGEKITGL
jgi:hypothetical protein